MHRFAHIADVHLGAHREPALQRVEQACFGQAMDKCIQSKVDFVLICGDLFHVGIPDLNVVNAALSKMMEVKEAGIPIYAIYGSHDYTPIGTSIIDLLNTAGALTNVSAWKLEEGKLKLRVWTDEGSGARIAGISARKIGLERKYYDMLDKKALEDVDGFKVFAFHSGITQFKPPSLAEMETVDISAFPSGFDYYAGGHIHQRGVHEAPGYPRVVFPGPLFTGYGKDVEETAMGEKRGFYLVEFDDRYRKSDFVQLDTFGGVFREVYVGGMNSVAAGKELARAFDGVDVDGMLVALKVKGALAGGRPSELGLGMVRSKLIESGAVYVYVNRAGVTSADSAAESPGSEDPAVIERSLFEQNASRVLVSQTPLVGKNGVETASSLLRNFRRGPKNEEQRKDYDDRMLTEGFATMKLEAGQSDN